MKYRSNRVMKMKFIALNEIKARFLSILCTNHINGSNNFKKNKKDHIIEIHKILTAFHLNA